MRSSSPRFCAGCLHPHCRLPSSLRQRVRDDLARRLGGHTAQAEGLYLFDHITLGRKVLDPDEPRQLHPAPRTCPSSVARLVLLRAHYPDAL